MKGKRRKRNSKTGRTAEPPPVSVTALLEEALAHLQAGNPAQAEPLLRLLLERDANNADGLHLLGLVAYQARRAEEAEDLIARAIAAGGDDPAFHSNHGAALNSLGRPAEAEAACRRAVDLAPDYAEAHNNLGLALELQDRPDEAAETYRRAIALEPGNAHALNNLGNVLRRQDDLDGAVQAYRRSVAAAPDFAMAQANLGAALREAGMVEEALTAGRRAVALAAEYAEGHNALGGTLLAAGDAEGALEAFRRAVELEPRYAEAGINLAAALFTLDRALEAEVAYRRVLDDDPGLAAAHNGLGVVLLAIGRLDEAVASFRRAVELMPRYAEALYNLATSRALEIDDADIAAMEGFRKAIPVVLSRSRQSDDEDSDVAAADQQLAMVLESYIDLLADVSGTDLERQAGIDAAAEAFRLADVARGQSVQSAVAASGARAAADSPELAELVRGEQDTAKQTATLFALLADVLASPTDQQDAAAVETLRSKIDQLRDARAVMMEEIEERFPEYAELTNPKPATIDQARAILRPGEALIATYVGARKTYVWAVPRDGAVAFTKADEGREDLEDTVALLRSSLEPNAQTLGDIPDFDVDVAHGLYDSLFKPVEAGWKKAKSLLVVAHGPLGYLPPSLLPTAPSAMGEEGGALFSNHRDVAWLDKSHAVTLLPSVASLKTLRSLPPGDDKRKSFAGFGDPFFNAQQATAQPAKQEAALTSRGLRTRGLPVRLRAAPKTAALDSAELGLLPRLPDTSDEVRSIAVAMKADLTQDVFLGRQANEGTVKSMDLSGYKVLAFATHGLVPGDLNGLTQPALALSAPGVSGTSGDGLLTMGEILGLKLDADWVVLSACNTGTGNGAGAEAVSGLGRAFFYAGTRALLVSNWPVETTSAKALTTDLFRRQAEDASLTRSEAHRRAMLALIETGGYVDPASGKTVFSYAHPIFWAPFTLIGDGGG
ncbi:MAG: CHAT domain-containing protein [Rhodospirillales bacterium]|nr:CHAT domain-containing protein [Rhodospirillales bacterium]